MLGISAATRHATPDQSMEYRHLRALWAPRMAGGFVAAAVGVGCLSYGAYGWAAFFLVLGVLNRHGWLLVRHYRSVRTSPSLSPRSQ